MVTKRQSLIFRLAAMLRRPTAMLRQQININDERAVANAIEEHLDGIKADGELYDQLPDSRGKFYRLVHATMKHLKM